MRLCSLSNKEVAERILDEARDARSQFDIIHTNFLRESHVVLQKKICSLLKLDLRHQVDIWDGIDASPPANFSRGTLVLFGEYSEDFIGNAQVQGLRQKKEEEGHSEDIKN